MKKLISVVGEYSEFIEQSEEAICSLQAVSDKMSTNDVVTEILDEIYGKKEWTNDTPEALGKPIQIDAHDVRVFFTKLNRGIHAVGFYIGTTLKTPLEVLTFFKKSVGVRAWGDFWYLDDVLEAYGKKSESVYLLTETSVADGYELKKRLGDEFGFIHAVAEDEAALPEADTKMKVKDSYDGVKREATRALSKLKTKWKGNAYEQRNATS